VTTGGAADAEDRRSQGHAIGLHDQVRTPSMWPTPRANDPEKRGNFNPHDPRTGLAGAVRLWPTPRAGERHQGQGAIQAYAEAGFKQPTTRNGKTRGRSTFDTTLSTAVFARQLWPTPTVGDHWNPSTPQSAEREWSKRNLRGIAAAPLWPTPTVTDATLGATHKKDSYGRHATQLAHLANSGRIHDPNWHLWPTPNVPNGGRSVSHAEQQGGSFYHKGKKVQFGLEAAVRKWPTPTAGDAIGSGSRNTEWSKAHSGLSLTDAVRGDQGTGRGGLPKRKNWPTPTSTLGDNAGLVTPAKAREGGTLVEAMSQELWPTPTARDWKDGSATSCASVPVNGLLGREVHQRGEAQLNGGGSLNPLWVEWLMGYPIGWTDCGHSATRSSRSSRS
jgi:hypothetical protein